MRILPGSFLLRAVCLFSIFAVGNLLFFFFTPQIAAVRYGPAPSLHAIFLWSLGACVLGFGLPANYVLASLITMGPSQSMTRMLVLFAIAPALNALLYAAIIPPISSFLRRIWQAIIYLPKEPGE